ncbi:MAG: hypothetical protein M3O34_18840 [Chloroflexota bacterium]|nr:hypothetical protein [Chloroflexota bacterium]
MATVSARWQRGADRLAGYAWLIPLVAVALALVGGAVYAATWEPRPAEAQVAVDECPDPPCFEGGGMPGLRDLPMTVSILGYLLAIALGLPSLLAGLWDVLRGRWPMGGRRLLALVGPVLFFVGTEVILHLLNPCYFALALAGQQLPEFYCEYSPVWGADLADHWHLLDHTLVGALPLATAYTWILRRWHPTVARLPRRRAARPA